MPCFLAIAKDACENEGKMWEMISIVRFQRLPQGIECEGKKGMEERIWRQ